MSKVYAIESDGAVEWYVADSSGQALEYWISQKRQNGEIRDDDGIDLSLSVVADDKPLTIGGDVPERTQTAAKWAEESEFGFLASTEF